MSTILSETNLGNGLIRYQYEGWYEDKSAPTVAPEPTAEEIAANARAWRDSELTSTDNTPSDHSQYDAIIAYRVSLRQWPSTADFPTIKPTLGS
tara:strand:- start:543 stop:824 length:282 start_codon:yes stop_codon:yes gene_type:complete